MAITILDGPMGTELIDRGVSLPAPLWSAHALETHPRIIEEIHREYAAAGAQVHTANTFRTTQRASGDGWEARTRKAITLARNSIPRSHRLAGSIAPLEDCYAPQDSPQHPGPEHTAFANLLAELGCDILLCETFPNTNEAISAVDAAVSTGVETWISFTAGYRGDLLTANEIAGAAAVAVDHGAAAVLVNCIPAVQTLAYVRKLSFLSVPFGAYANAGSQSDGLGWGNHNNGPDRYADLAQTWIDAGATLIGGCCGTNSDTIAALARRFRPDTLKR